MYPNQPQPSPNPSNPADYLNQISSQAPKSEGFKLSIKFALIVGGALVAAVFAAALIVNLVVGSTRGPLQHLAARLEATQTIVAEAQPHLKSSSLRSLNSNLNLYLTDTNSKIAEPFKTAGVNVDKISDGIIAEESTEALAERLESARLNARYDRTYAREMAYQLDTILTLTKQIYNGTSNQELVAFLEDTYNKLAQTQQSFAEFNTGSD